MPPGEHNYFLRVSSTRPAKERERGFSEAARERERKVKNNKLYNSHKRKISSHENSLNVGKKISKILCGCTNPKNIMAPTDHCRTQNEHRNGRTDPR